MNLHKRTKYRIAKRQALKLKKAKLLKLRERKARQELMAMYKDDPVAQMVMQHSGPLHVQRVVGEDADISNAGAYPQNYSINIKGNDVTITEPNGEQSIETLR